MIAGNSTTDNSGGLNSVYSMEKPPNKPPHYRPQPEAQHRGQDPRLRGREANNLIGVGSLNL
jgi:hypothetical protein